MEDNIKTILDKIRPSLKADGGDVEFVGIKDNIVKVKLTGACGICPYLLQVLLVGWQVQMLQ